MKNPQQQELCRLINEFYDNRKEETFHNLVNGLFRTSLLFPMAQQDGKKQFLMAQRDNRRVFAAFTDMEEAQKGNLTDVDFVPFSVEDYSSIVAKSEAESLVINLFSEKNCIINKNFFVDVICKAFEENRIMPALQPTESEEYIPIHKLPFTIGRSSQADLTIDKNTINEIHSMIVEKDNKYFILDQNSLNGLFVNGKQVEKGEERQIFFDDVIEFYEEAYTFVALGLAYKEESSMYAEDDRTMLANAMYVMQRHLVINEFFNQTENFLHEMMEDEGKKNYHKYFFIGIEMTCDMREKELGITDRDVIERQRRRMIGKGAYIFQENDYGFRRLEQEGMQIYVVDFPKILHINELAKRIYLVIRDNGDKLAYVVRMTEDGTSLIQINQERTEISLGEAPETQEEEVYKVLENERIA